MLSSLHAHCVISSFSIPTAVVLLTIIAGFYSVAIIWYTLHHFDPYGFLDANFNSYYQLNIWHPPFSNESDTLKIPTTYTKRLYRNEGEYFSSFTHYKDNWQYLTQTNWTIPVNISTKYKTKSKQSNKQKYTKWRYTIINYPIFPFFLKSSKVRVDDMITIVTQCSLSRLPMIYKLAEHWHEVISLAIYIPLEDSLFVWQQRIYNFWHNVEMNTPTILDIHLLFEIDYINKTAKNGRYRIMYPVNHLRNVALQCAKSEYVLLSDADFIPSDGFHILAKKDYKYSLNIIQDTVNTSNQSHYIPAPNLALIFPAFELNLTKHNQWNFTVNFTVSSLPSTKEEVVDSYTNNRSRAFHSNRCPRCHRSTNYLKWADNSTIVPYKVEYRAHYEPYILTKRVGLHRYDARFRGYGLNKIYHLEALAKLHDYEWVVSSHCFLFHIPHEQSRDHKVFSKKRRREWVHGLAMLASRELRRKRDAAGYITA